MPGRTLASFYGNNGETSESPQQTPREPFYQSPVQESGQTGTPQQYDASYYYPNVNPTTGYPSAQYVAPYSYSAPSQSSRHDSMSYPNSQGAYNATPGHYASPGHVQTSSGYTGGGQWPPQQTEFAAPAPAHASGQHALPGQFQRGRMPPVGVSPPVQHPAWTHTPPQAVAGGALAPSGYYPAPPQLAHRGPGGGERPAWGKPAHQPNGSPLFSLQMLVNQDLTRAAAAAAQQVNNYEASETVDLSSTATPMQMARPVERPTSRNGRISVPTPPVNNGSADNVVSSSSRPKSEPSSSLSITKVESSETHDAKKAVNSDISELAKPADKAESAARKQVTGDSVSSRKSGDLVSTKDPSGSIATSSAKSPADAAVKVVKSPAETAVKGTKSPTESAVTVVKSSPETAVQVVKSSADTSVKVTKSPTETVVKAASTDERSKTPESAKSTAKRAKKVDSLLESLAPRDLTTESKEDVADDDDKPRRKRKLEKPIRVAKTDGHETTGRRRSTSEGSEPIALTPPKEAESEAKRQRRKSESDQLVVVKEEPSSSSVVVSSETEAKNSFTEVESELEKMFAGMEEVAMAPVVVKTETPETPKAPKRDRRSRAKVPKSTESPEKKRSGKKASTGKKGKVSEPAIEEGSKGLDSGSNASVGKFRGPLIRVQGETVNVYNAPTQMEAEVPRPPPAGRRKQAAYHSDLDYRAEGKLCASMFSSTLSARYDAHTTDRAWLCAFCKAGPHSNTGQFGPANGDLFGPYLIAARDRDEAADATADDRDLNAEQKKGGRNKKSLRKSDTLEQFRKKMSKKAKRAAAAAEAAQPSGMVARGNGCYEVWTHESCALWAAGTRVVGSRVYGLQEAVWAALSSTCHKCGNAGATVSCAARGCSWRLHVDCAFALSWELNEDSFLARCPAHRIKHEASTSTATG